MTTLCVNIKNKAAAQLLDHAFNSYANIDGVYFAASDDGLFRVMYGGARDEYVSTAIVPTSMTHNGEVSGASVVLDSGEYCYDSYSFDAGTVYRVTYSGSGTSLHLETQTEAHKDLVAENIITNGTFSTDTSNWESFNSASLSVSSGKLRITNTATYGVAYQCFPTVVGQIYTVQANTYLGTSAFVGLGITQGSVTGTAYSSINYYSNQEPIIRTFKAVTTETCVYFIIDDAAGSYGEVDDVSVKATGNLVVNGEFSVDSSWTLGTGFSIGSGVASATAGTASRIQQNSVLPDVGSTVTVQFTAAITSGEITPFAGSGGGGTARSTSGTYTEELTVTTDTDFSFYKNAAFAGTISDVTVYAGGEEEFSTGTSVSLPYTTVFTATTEDMVGLIGGTVTGITVEEMTETEIDAAMTTASTDMGDSNPKRISAAYIGYETDGDIKITPYADETLVGSYTLENKTTGQQRARQKIGQGRYGRYWEFKIENVDGSDFSIDSVEVEPIILNHGRG